MQATSKTLSASHLSTIILHGQSKYRSISLSDLPTSRVDVHIIPKLNYAIFCELMQEVKLRQ